ncbi:MAG TPA: DUF883 family protein [Lacunisphaera sp.]|nr:DUF883 family protein [Lacunisphaera sp.]
MASSSARTEPQITEELRTLIHEAEQVLGRSAQDAGGRIDDLRNRLRDVLQDGRHSLERLRGQAMQRARQADQLVRDNPYYAIGVAAGVGALIGVLVSRACNSSR